MNPQKIVLVLALYGIGTCLFAQDKINVFYIGHSLSDQIPDMVASLSNQAKPGTFNWTYQGIPGAPLRWQWQRKTARDYNPIPLLPLVQCFGANCLPWQGQNAGCKEV